MAHLNKNKLNSSINNGMGYIRHKQNRDGLWRDFDTLAGASSEWVTGFVSYAISNDSNINDVLLNSIKGLTIRQRPNGGWSFNSIVPTDCDSTAWALLATTTSYRWRPSVIMQGIDYIKRHQDKKSGGFSTYNDDDNIQDFIGAQRKDVIGWTDPHIDVTSVATQSMLFNGISRSDPSIKMAIRFLKGEKNYEKPIWSSYWWNGYTYSTYNALKTLLINGVIKENELMESINYLLSQQFNDGGWDDTNECRSTVFATSFAILTLLLRPTTQVIQALTKSTCWLMNEQNHNGSWPPSPILRIPFPMIRKPNEVRNWSINSKGTGVIIEDKNKIFTTSAAIWALSLFNSIIQ